MSVCKVQEMNSGKYVTCDEYVPSKYAWKQAIKADDDSGFVFEGDPWNGLSIGWKDGDTLYGYRIGLFNKYRNEKLVGAEVGIYNSRTEVDGVQIGVINYIRQKLNGAQIGILANDSDGVINGLQAAVVYNGTLETNGAQASILANYSDDMIRGAQLAFFGNISNGVIEGTQLAILGNRSYEQVYGLQASFIMNQCNWDVYGLQLGMINDHIPMFFLGLDFARQDAPTEYELDYAP